MRFDYSVAICGFVIFTSNKVQVMNAKMNFKRHLEIEMNLLGWQRKHTRHSAGYFESKSSRSPQNVRDEIKSTDCFINENVIFFALSFHLARSDI